MHGNSLSDIRAISSLNVWNNFLWNQLDQRINLREGIDSVIDSQILWNPSPVVWVYLKGKGKILIYYFIYLLFAKCIYLLSLGSSFLLEVIYEVQHMSMNSTTELTIH